MSKYLYFIWFYIYHLMNDCDKIFELVKMQLFNKFWKLWQIWLHFGWPLAPVFPCFWMICDVQCFNQKILLEGKSGPWRLVLGAIFFRKGAKRTIQRHTWGRQWSRVIAMHYRAISNMVSHLEVFCWNPWVAGTWQQLKRRTGYALSVLEGCMAEKTADIFPARVQHFAVWHKCGSWFSEPPFQQHGSFYHPPSQGQQRYSRNVWLWANPLRKYKQIGSFYCVPLESFKRIDAFAKSWTRSAFETFSRWSKTPRLNL